MTATLFAFAAASLSGGDNTAMQRVIAALIVKDEALVSRESSPTVLTTDRNVAGEPVALTSMLEKVRNCEVGAVMKRGVKAAYTVNWWCAYRSESEGSLPLNGASAVLSQQDGKVQFSNFGLDGPYPMPPRAAQ